MERLHSTPSKLSFKQDLDGPNNKITTTSTLPGSSGILKSDKSDEDSVLLKELEERLPFPESLRLY